MAQIDGVVFQHMGTVQITKNITYSASQFADLFTGADIFIFKSNIPAKISVNKTPPFEMKKNDFTYYDGSTTLNYVFDRDCLIAVGKLR